MTLQIKMISDKSFNKLLFLFSKNWTSSGNKKLS